MTSPHKPRFQHGLWLPILMIVGAALQTSCSKEEENTAPPPTTSQGPSTAPPEQPRLRPDDLNLAEGVQFPIERIPGDESAARAVASLANAIARGDDQALANMLDRPSAGVLDHLVSTGAWSDAVESNQVVRVCALESSNGALRVGLGIEDERGAYLLGWNGQQSRGAWTFSAIPVESPPASTATDLDGASLQDMTPPSAG